MEKINYVAACGTFSFLGVAEDPATQVADMQPSCPYPIELMGGWVLDRPQDQIAALNAVRIALHHSLHRDGWFKIKPDRALAILGKQVEEYGGRPWRASSRSRPAAVASPGLRRAVVTPQGTFPSANAAGEAYGISRQAAWERAARWVPGWHFADAVMPRAAKRGSKKALDV